MEKKYIIELPENTHWIQWIMEGTKNHHPYMDFSHVEDLTPYTEPDLEQVKRDYDAWYEKGLADAWEAARKICLTESEGGVSGKTVCYIFNTEYYRDALKDYTPAKAIEKIQQYEQEKEEQDGLRQNIQTIVDQCGYTLDEIAEVLQKMKES